MERILEKTPIEGSPNEFLVVRLYHSPRTGYFVTASRELHTDGTWQCWPMDAGRAPLVECPRRLNRKLFASLVVPPAILDKIKAHAMRGKHAGSGR